MVRIVKEQVWPLLADVVSTNLAKTSQIERHHDSVGLVTVRNASDMERIST